jgi:hypothetical protein
VRVCRRRYRCSSGSRDRAARPSLWQVPQTEHSSLQVVHDHRIEKQLGQGTELLVTGVLQLEEKQPVVGGDAPQIDCAPAAREDRRGLRYPTLENTNRELPMHALQTQDLPQRRRSWMVTGKGQLARVHSPEGPVPELHWLRPDHHLGVGILGSARTADRHQ